MTSTSLQGLPVLHKIENNDITENTQKHHRNIIKYIDEHKDMTNRAQNIYSLLWFKYPRIIEIYCKPFLGCHSYWPPGLGILDLLESHLLLLDVFHGELLGLWTNISPYTDSGDGLT